MQEELERIARAVDPCADAAIWALTDDEVMASLDAVHAVQQRLAALQLDLVRAVDSRALAVAQGAPSTSAWLRERLRITGRSARRLVDRAASLDAGPAVVHAALARGAITVEQAQVVADAVAALPADAVEAADKAAHLLLDWATRFEPSILRGLGERILYHVAPDLADDVDRAALEAAEARAHRGRHLTLSTNPDGRLRLSGTLDPETAALFHAAIDPLTAPHGLDDHRTPGQRRCDALADICRLALHTAQLPDNGGDRPQVVVTTEYDTLTRQLHGGILDTGHRLTPATVRRLACDAAILPAVLDGNGQPLDLGRQRRLFNGPLRRALVLRDAGCAFPGCDRPPRWCDGHHVTHWADGGATTLTNAVLLCRHHHRLVHHTPWAVRIAPDGVPEFIPPPWLDPHRAPLRNHHHHRRP